MRLSEAIRAGAEIRPQCKDVFYNLLDGVVCSCALGAAFEGAGLIKTSELNTRPVSVNINLCAYFDGLEKIQRRRNNHASNSLPCSILPGTAAANL